MGNARKKILRLTHYVFFIAPIHRLNHPSNISDRVCLSRSACVRLWKPRCVIHHKRAIEASISIDRHRSVHIYIAFIEKNLLETGQAAADIAEMNEDDFVLGSHLPDRFIHIYPHLGDASLTEQHSVGVGWDNVEDPPVLVER